MRMKKSWLAWRAGTVLLALLPGACVTINIYFPAAAAEKAADRIIDEVYQLKTGEAPKPAAPAPQAPQANPAEKK
jgi:hypothetical protein